VAITVILAAVIAAFVFGMAGEVHNTKNVAAVAEQVNSTGIIVTYHGGKDVGYVTNLSIAWPGTAPTIVASPPSVGQSWHSMTGTSGKDRVIVVARFNDEKEQVILDTTV